MYYKIPIPILHKIVDETFVKDELSNHKYARH